MAKKQSSSHVPNGGYSLTNGSNYMLDGFQYDTEYNNGVLEKARLPEAKGLAQLPSGMIPMESNLFSEIPTSENQLDLTSFTKEAGFQSINLVDHSWLAQESKKLHNETKMKNRDSLDEYYDKGKLTDSAIDELAELWGNSTDGLRLIPNTNRQHAPYENNWDAPLSNYGGDPYKKVQNKAWTQEKIESAMRKSAYGQPIKQVLASLKEELGDHADSYADAFQRIANEHGLHGKVFIREEAFPGLFNGKWSNHIHKRCASVQYIIPKNSDCAYDRYMGCAVVSEASLPWKQAYDSYIPKLRTAGVKIASTGTYQERLKKAFLSKAMDLSVPQTWFVTDDQSSRQLKQAKAVVDVVPTAQEREEAKGVARLTRIASDVVKGGFLSQSQVDGVLGASMSTQDKVAQLYKLASQPKKTASYAGEGKDVYIHTPTKSVVEAPKMSKQASQNLKVATENMKKIDQLVKSGLISIEKVQKIACGCTDTSYQEMLDKVMEQITLAEEHMYEGAIMSQHVMASGDPMNKPVSEKEMELREKKACEKVQALVDKGLITADKAEAIYNKKASALPEERVDAVLRYLAKPKKTASYQGQQYTAHVSAPVQSQNSEDPEWKKMASWIRTQMSEGMMGHGLNTMIETRFSSELLNKHQDRIASLRAQHEGLSGQLYVDGQVYGMKKEGCDAGASQHRANTIPAVLGFEKCEGCVYKNANSVCQKYNKPVVTKVAELVEDARQYQKESIRLANASDSDRTASLFNNYDASEFNLTSDDGIIDFSEVETETPSKLASVLFGGYEIEEE